MTEHAEQTKVSIVVQNTQDTVIWRPFHGTNVIMLLAPLVDRLVFVRNLKVGVVWLLISDHSIT